MTSARYSSQILMKLGFSGLTFEKITIIKFHENNSSGSRRTDGRRDRHDEAISRVYKFLKCFWNKVGVVKIKVSNFILKIMGLWNTKVTQRTAGFSGNFEHDWFRLPCPVV
jgi:hypothetical protein